MAEYKRQIDTENLWRIIQQEATEVAEQFPLLAGFYQRNILKHNELDESLAYILAEKLADQDWKVDQWQEFLLQIIDQAPQILRAARKDLLCQLESNSCIKDHYTPLLHFGGYQALQCHRFAHYCWNNDMQPMATYIQGKVVTQFGVDIHPGAYIGEGIFMDHAVGIVIGETAVVEDDVTLFQSVTLGGTGKGTGDRHPKIRKGAFVGSGAVIFGNIEVGEQAKVAGGAVVVKPVEAGATVVGPVARSLK